MSGIQTLRTDALSETPSTPGIKRNLAFNGEGYLVVRARSDPGVVSGWHHHGDYEVYGFVASGSVLFESDPENINPISLNTGDFFHVPAHTIHREINPSSEKQNEVILFLLGTGPLVINLDDKEPT